MPVPTSFADLSSTPSANSPPGSETVGPFANDYFQAAFAFICQLYQNGGVPITALNVNGQKVTNVANGVALTDAVNLSQLNTTLGGPSGTRVVFQQATAPIGWAIDVTATFTDCAMRFNQAAGNGGTTAWSAFNAGNQFNVSSTSLTVAQMPAHAHSDAGHNHGLGDGGHNHGYGDSGHAHSQINISGSGIGGSYFGNGTNNFSGGGSGMFGWGGTPFGTSVSGIGISISASGSNISIAAANANIQNTGGGGGHIHTWTTPVVKYADCVVGIKS